MSLTADARSYSTNAWVFDVQITPEQASLVATNPLAIQTSDTPPSVLFAEQPDGLYANIEPFSLRLNPGEFGEATVYASQFGAPLANQTLPLGFQPGPDGTNDPRMALGFYDQVKLDASGKGTLRVSASQPNPLGPARKFIGSLVFFLGEDWEKWGQISLPTTSISPLSVLVFGSGAPVTSPTWEDVGPLLTQYARIFPGMKARLDLSNYEAVKQGAGPDPGSHPVAVRQPRSHARHPGGPLGLQPGDDRDLDQQWLPQVRLTQRFWSRRSASGAPCPSLSDQQSNTSIASPRVPRRRPLY